MSLESNEIDDEVVSSTVSSTPISIATPHPTSTMLLPKRPLTMGFQYSFDAWGQSYWEVMHSVTFSYPETSPTEEQKQRIIDTFRLIPFLLPCSMCGLHFVTTMKEEHPLTDKVLLSRDALTRWLVNVHNSVNRRIGRSEIPYDTVNTFYLKDVNVPSMRQSQRVQTLLKNAVTVPKWVLPLGIVSIISILVCVMVIIIFYFKHLKASAKEE